MIFSHIILSRVGVEMFVKNRNSIDYKKAIDLCRIKVDKFRNSSKFLKSFKQRKFKVEKSEQMKKCCDHRFDELYREQELLFNDGYIVWGGIIQANTGLFSPGEEDLPANVIFSLDDSIDSNPNMLLDVAKYLFTFKGEDCEADSELQEFADNLADEIEPKYNLKIPTSISYDIECYYTIAMIFRKYIPQGYLVSSLFPYFVKPDETKASLMVPMEFWTKEFIERTWS